MSGCIKSQHGAARLALLMCEEALGGISDMLAYPAGSSISSISAAALPLPRLARAAALQYMLTYQVEAL